MTMSKKPKTSLFKNLFFNMYELKKRVTSHYFEFNSGHPKWRTFDISSCVANTNRLFLKITLKGDRQSLVFNLFSLGISETAPPKNLCPCVCVCVREK